MDTTTFRTSSGRIVGVTEFGDTSSPDVVVLSHPAPGSSRFDPGPRVTAARGARVIALDRPGYGASEMHGDNSSGSVADAADDIAEYLRAHGVERVGAAGWSAGGRVALALAANHPALVRAVAVIATPAPDDEVPWAGDDNRAMTAELVRHPLGVASAELAAIFAQMIGEDPTAETVLPMLSADEADESLRASARDRLLGMLERALDQRYTGMAADIISYLGRDLGFDLASVSAPPLLVYGSSDGVIGADHGEWYRAHIAGATLELVPGAGHMVVVPAWERVLAHLAP